MAGRCVCQICTCGRHRCPHKRGTLGAEPVKLQCDLTEYTQKFQPHEFQCKRTTIRPTPQTPISSAPFEGETTYNKNYSSKKPQRIQLKQPENRPPSGTFYFDSTYSKEFTPKKGNRGEPIRHLNQYVLPLHQYNDGTEYSRSFQAKGLGPRKPIRHSSNLQVNIGDVEKTTTMKQDYRKYEHVDRRPRALPPKDNHSRWNGGNLGCTSYMADFGTKEIPEPHVMIKREYERPTKPFTNLSTYRNTYKAPTVQRKVSSYKPTNTYVPPMSPFVGKTTTKETYQPWDIVPRPKQAWVDRKLQTPDGTFNHSTSYKEEFLGRPGQREKPASNRAHTTIDISNGPKVFHKNTEYTDRYKEHEGGPRVIPKPQTMQTYVPGGEMDCKTTYNNDYTSKKAEKVPLTNPGLRKTTGDNWGFDSSYDTTYNETFKGNQAICPATGLVPTSGGSKLLKETTSNLDHTLERGGHYYFKTRGEARVETPVKTPVNQTNNATSKIPTPRYSPVGRLNSPGVKFNTPIKKLSFSSPSFDKSTPRTFGRQSTPLPNNTKNSSDAFRDLVADEASYCREGTEYYEANTTVNSITDDQVPCTCNTSYNNNNWIQNNNNNYKFDKELLESSYLPGTTNTVALDQILEVTSIKPNKEKVWNLSL